MNKFSVSYRPCLYLFIALSFLLAACSESDTPQEVSQGFPSVVQDDLVLIDEITEDTDQARVFEAKQSECSSAYDNTKQQRAGERAIEFHVSGGCNRAELAGAYTEYDQVYRYEWSLYFPETWQASNEGFDILAQWVAWPSPRDGQFPCGGAGSLMKVTDNILRMEIGHPGGCTRWDIADVRFDKGEWIDFVMGVRWTESGEGYLDLYYQIGDKPWVARNYKGATWWADEGPGPYFKMGIYKGGGPDQSYPWKGPNRLFYADEYRLFKR